MVVCMNVYFGAHVCMDRRACSISRRPRSVVSSSFFLSRCTAAFASSRSVRGTMGWSSILRGSRARAKPDFFDFDFQKLQNSRDYYYFNQGLDAPLAYACRPRNMSCEFACLKSSTMQQIALFQSSGVLWSRQTCFSKLIFWLPCEKLRNSDLLFCPVKKTDAYLFKVSSQEGDSIRSCTDVCKT
jgi:hypothetical protein